jgi:hypothetical protein
LDFRKKRCLSRQLRPEEVRSFCFLIVQPHSLTPLLPHSYHSVYTTTCLHSLSDSVVIDKGRITHSTQWLSEWVTEWCGKCSRIFHKPAQWVSEWVSEYPCTSSPPTSCSSQASLASSSSPYSSYSAPRPHSRLGTSSLGVSSLSCVGAHYSTCHSTRTWVCIGIIQGNMCIVFIC